MHKFRDIDLNLFVVLDALLRLRSVSKAALTLGVSQSSVSQALKRLREHFGDPLFLKVQQGVAEVLAQPLERLADRALTDPEGQGRLGDAAQAEERVQHHE